MPHLTSILLCTALTFYLCFLRYDYHQLSYSRQNLMVKSAYLGGFLSFLQFFHYFFTKNFGD